MTVQEHPRGLLVVQRLRRLARGEGGHPQGRRDHARGRRVDRRRADRRLDGEDQGQARHDRHADRARRAATKKRSARSRSSARASRSRSSRPSSRRRDGKKIGVRPAALVHVGRPRRAARGDRQADRPGRARASCSTCAATAAACCARRCSSSSIFIEDGADRLDEGPAPARARVRGRGRRDRRGHPGRRAGRPRQRERVRDRRPARCATRTARTLVGERTFGKGVFQELEPLSNGGALDLTVGSYYLPSGENISKTGIKPEVKARDQPADAPGRGAADRARRARSRRSSDPGEGRRRIDRPVVCVLVKRGRFMTADAAVPARRPDDHPGEGDATARGPARWCWSAAASAARASSARSATPRSRATCWRRSWSTAGLRRSFPRAVEEDARTPRRSSAEPRAT